MAASFFLALGVILLAVEVALRPWYAAAGVAGGVLLCTSLGLLAYGQWPRGPVGWGEYGFAFTQAALGILVALGLATLLTRYLPRVPAGRRLLPSTGAQPVLPSPPVDPSSPLYPLPGSEGEAGDHDHQALDGDGVRNDHANKRPPKPL